MDSAGGDSRRPTGPRKSRAHQEVAVDPDFDRGPAPDSANTQLYDPRVASSSKSQAQASKTTPAGSSTRHEDTDRRSQAHDHRDRGAYLQNQSYRSSQSSQSHGKRPNIQDIPVTLPSVEKVMVEIQAAYHEISHFEVQCMHLSKELAQQQQQRLDASLPLEWSDEAFMKLFQCQTSLIDKYFDFIFLAYHPCGNSLTRGLVKKYRIPIRTWNKGIFKFLDILRAYMPHSQDLITKFIYHCFSLLTMLVDPLYETRHMWLEALGDLARFSMALGSESHSEWRGASQYWYSRAANRSPGVGRLFHHCAVVCIYRLDSLFYFCRSLTSTQQFEPSLETILSLFDSNQEAAIDTPIASFIKLHQINFTGGNVEEFERTLHYVCEALTLSTVNSKIDDTDIDRRGGTVALCNITTLLSYGSASNPIMALFTDKISVEGAQPTGAPASMGRDSSAGSEFAEQSVGDPTAQSFGSTKPEPKVYGSLELSRRMSFEILTRFLKLGYDVALPHVIVWLHFLRCICHSEEATELLIMSPEFPLTRLVRFLNRLMQIGTQILAQQLEETDNVVQAARLWKKQASEKKPAPEDLLELLRVSTKEAKHVRPVPMSRERPLPEELLLLGLVWSGATVEQGWYTEYDSSTTDEPYPGYPGRSSLYPTRVIRVIELATSLADNSHWLELQGGVFRLNRNTEDDMSDSEYSTTAPY